MRLRYLSIFFICCSFLGCQGDRENSFLNASLDQSLTNLIVVSNQGNKNVVLLKSDGTWARDLLSLDRTTTDVPYGLAQVGTSVLVTVDGVDRVLKVNLNDSSVSDFILNSNLTGNLKGITSLISGDVLVTESNNVERFDANGQRVTTGGWPKALQTAGSGLSALADGGFIQCSTGTDVIRSYTDAGTQTATASSGITGTTDVVACGRGPQGQIYAIFNGTTDTIRVFTDSSFSSVVYDYTNTALLGNPKAASFDSSGNLFVVDGTNNLILQLNPRGELIKTIASSAVSLATDILVVK